MIASRWATPSLCLVPLLAAVAPPAAAMAQAAPVTVSGRVIPAGGGDVRGVKVVARAGERADSAEVDSAGRFTLALAAAPWDSVDVWFAAADTAARTFAPARLRLRLLAQDAARAQEVVLLPLRWTIRGGRYAGRVVDVPLERAFRAPCAACGGFYRRIVAHDDSARALLQGWPAERFPLRVAFDREWNGEKVTAGDSVAFWREADELNQTFGAELFRPANYPDTTPRPDGGPDDVVLVWFDPAMTGLSGLGTAVSSGDDIGYGDVRLNRSALRDAQTYPGLVEHELMHTLGFGHTCAWPSVVADVRRCPSQRAPAATEQDVAYAQLAAALRALLQEHHGAWGLEAALAALPAPDRRGLATR